MLTSNSCGCDVMGVWVGAVKTSEEIVRCDRSICHHPAVTGRDQVKISLIYPWGESGEKKPFTTQFPPRNMRFLFLRYFPNIKAMGKKYKNWFKNWFRISFQI